MDLLGIVLHLRWNTEQEDARITHYLIEEGVTPATFWYGMGAIVELDGGDDSARREIAKDEVEVFLSDFSSGALVPHGIRASNDIGQPNFGENHHTYMYCDS